jgi:hypothetical protein
LHQLFSQPSIVRRNPYMPWEPSTVAFFAGTGAGAKAATVKTTLTKWNNIRLSASQTNIAALGAAAYTNRWRQPTYSDFKYAHSRLPSK